jgi:hypothetical protein
MASAYDFAFKRLTGEALPLKEFQGKAILIVNTASECGYTPQYDELEKLWQANKDKGLTVLGVPCNQFGGQEPGSEAEIGAFCRKNYGVTFPLTEERCERQSRASLLQMGGRAGGRSRQAQMEFPQIPDRPRWHVCRLVLEPDQAERAEDQKGAGADPGIMPTVHASDFAFLICSVWLICKVACGR